MSFSSPLRAAFLALGLVTPALADPLPAEDRQSFIEANVLWVFYHELGHALIDQLELPVLGKEEDAADQLAVLMTDLVWQDEAAAEITAHVGQGFRLADQSAIEPFPWWDEHSSDLQRYYTTMCLYYGGDPERRGNVLDESDLPAERAELCVYERAMLEDSWGQFLDDLTEGHPPRFSDQSGGAAPEIAALLAEEVTALAEEISLPDPLEVVLTSCGEENAFYDPDEGRILICTEFVDFMGRLWQHKADKG
ncbi:MAG: DUF4344 domain-containing metallopeptidase [Paracoccus sp. (in: a-proteobacteria)]|nr:DUF4344 domain-containing metallopeptidase [Paracoccus sp. (in: a-proteobacteria)]